MLIMPILKAMKNIMNNIMTDNKIKQARKAAGLTQSEMSELFHIPIDTIKGWDSGRTYPPEWAEILIVEKLKKIAEENLKAL